MDTAAPIVTVFGGTGFIGRYVVQRMARRGWRVRVAVRRPNEGMFVLPYGDVGQIRLVQANIRDEASTRAAMQGASAVVNCVGILFEDAKQGFDAVHAEAAGRIARLAAEAGAERLVHISAIGADAESESGYARSKAAGETAAREAFPDVVILRPSIVFGPEDQFFNRFAGMARISPVLALVGGETKFQPVYVDDVAEAAALGAEGKAEPGVYELGGPTVATFRELMTRMLGIVRRRRMVWDMPQWLAKLQAGIFGLVETVTFGLIENRMITRDQIVQLSHDNVVTEDVRTFADLGIEPTPMGAVLEDYLYPYRPYGQYARITSSADNLRA